METPVLNAIETVLRTHRKGKLLTELTEAMQKAVTASREHAAASKIVLTLEICPANGDASQLSVQDSVRVKLPEPKKPKSLFYATDDGRLVREDPNQAEMQLTVTSAPTASSADREPIVINQ